VELPALSARLERGQVSLDALEPFLEALVLVDQLIAARLRR
jgi:hypothetical protein